MENIRQELPNPFDNVKRSEEFEKAVLDYAIPKIEEAIKNRMKEKFGEDWQDYQYDFAKDENGVWDFQKIIK